MANSQNTSGTRIKKGEVKYRVSRPGGWFMMMVAFVLDMLPFIVLIGVAAWVLTMTGTVGYAVCEKEYWNPGAVAAEWVLENVFGATSPAKKLNFCKVAGLSNEEVGGAALGIAAFFFAGPLFGISVGIFTASTIVAALFAFLLFPLWFYFGKNYIMVSFTHPKKVVVNIVSFIITTILKWMPVVNLFPLPVYTITVWKHIQLSREEDRERFAENEKKRMAGEREATRRRERQIASTMRNRNRQMGGNQEPSSTQEGYLYA